MWKADRIGFELYDRELLTLELWLDRANRQWQRLQARLPKLPPRWVFLLTIGSLVLWTVLVRCLHLIESDHYYMVSPDSYFFHWVARGIMEGHTPPSLPYLSDTYWLHSGLAYPLAYVSEAITSVFGVSQAGALDFVSKVMPPTLGVVTMFVVYGVGAKMLGRRAGLFAALTWATLAYAYVTGLAGYVDRDGLSALLILLGASVFYLSRDWTIKIGERNVGWLVGGVSVLVIEGLLYLEWTFVGSGLLLAILGAYALLRFLMGYTSRLQAEPNPARRIADSLREINPRTLAVVVAGNLAFLALLGAANPSQLTSWFDTLRALLQSGGGGKGLGGTAIAEEVGISVGNIVAFRFLLIPMAIGVVLAARRRSEGVIFIASWFVCLLVLSLFAVRLLLYAAPAASLLAGAGLAAIWDWQERGSLRPARTFSAVLLLILIVGFSISAYSISSTPGTIMAPDRDWQDTLAYLRDRTPEESVVMTHWNYGYWILDLGQRRPVVDNGYYYFDSERNHDIGVAYSTDDPAEAVAIMDKYGADYLIFSTLDLGFAGAIIGEANLGTQFEGLSEFPPDSLVRRTLSGDFESGGGLEVVYRSMPDSDVAILRAADDA